MGENYITCQESNGSINISEEVISALVRAAATQVEGVAGLSNTSGAELVELIGIKTLSKGVKVQFDEGRIIVDAIITVSRSTVQNSVSRAWVTCTSLSSSSRKSSSRRGFLPQNIKSPCQNIPSALPSSPHPRARRCMICCAF